MSIYKLNISKPGFNVLTETDPNNLIFSSDYNTLKYYLSGSITVNGVDDGTLYTQTVAHNLGYIPFFTAYTFALGSTTLFAIVPNNQQTVAGRNYQNVYADSTNLIFATQQNQGTGNPNSYTFYYKIFKNNLGY